MLFQAFDIFWVIDPIEFLIFNEAVSLLNFSIVEAKLDITPIWVSDNWSLMIR